MPLFSIIFVSDHAGKFYETYFFQWISIIKIQTRNVFRLKYGNAIRIEVEIISLPLINGNRHIFKDLILNDQSMSISQIFLCSLYMLYKA